MRQTVVAAVLLACVFALGWLWAGATSSPAAPDFRCRFTVPQLYADPVAVPPGLPPAARRAYVIGVKGTIDTTVVNECP
jgi:hypothetical protein